jgi:hypothetical protein
VLSSRSPHRSVEIMVRHRQVRVALDNQFGVDAADIAVRIGELPFPTMVGVRAMPGSPPAGLIFKALEIPRWR